MVQTSKAPKAKYPVLKFANLTAESMRNSLPTAMSNYGEGCLNEPMRIFSDYGNDESIVNHLHEPGFENMAHHAVDETLSRVAQHCVVGILERCSDTKVAISKYLPFLNPYFRCAEKANKGRVVKGQLEVEQEQAIKELAKHEYQVYEEANHLLDAQLER